MKRGETMKTSATAARAVPQVLAFSALLACGGGEPGANAEMSEGSAVGESVQASTPSYVRLYAVDRYEHVRRLDPASLEVIDSIVTGPRPHGIVASHDGRSLYITLEVSNEVIEVDVATHEIVARAAVGAVPNEPTMSADGRYLFVPLRGGAHTDVVDTETMTRVASLPTGRAGHNAYTSPDGTRVYSTSMGDSLIAVIDPQSLEITRKIRLNGIPRPVALTRDNLLAYVALSGLTGFVTVDLSTDTEVHRESISIADDTPVPTLDTYTHGLQLTPDERELWVAAYGSDRVHGFLLPEYTHFADIPVDGGPHWLTLHPDGEPLYVTLERAGRVAAIHRGLREVIRVADVGQGPTRILAFRTPVADGLD
jgi:YVTN family beta-propeller protein